MKTERILPVDLYNSVSTPELKLESSLKILYVKEGDDDKLLPLDSGTLAVICTGGSFRCQALHHAYEVTPGQLLLLASDDVTEVKPFHDTGFIGIIIYVSEELLINRQRLVYRNIPSDEVEETRIYLRLIESQIEQMKEMRAKVVESLLRALIINLQQGKTIIDAPKTENSLFFQQFATLISRYHHSPAYFYAEKLGINSQELNIRCKQGAGISAAEWISEFVLLEAKDLLSKTRLRPSQIATMLGFANHDTFSRWFRRHTGEIPTEWR